jgi:energy-coupling factor transport system permease protein
MKPCLTDNSRANFSPACLLVGALVYLGGLVFVHRSWGLLAMIGLWSVALAGLRLSFVSMILGLRRVWIFLVLTFVIHVIASSHWTATWHKFPTFEIGSESWVTASFFVVRLALIVSVSIALFQLYDPQEYGRSIGRLFARSPIGRSAMGQLELILTLAMRFIPTIDVEFRRLKLALSARGIEAQNSMSERVALLRKIMYPLVLNSFRRAEHVSLALEARGYDRHVRRTSLHRVALVPAHVLLTGLFSVFCLMAPWL